MCKPKLRFSFDYGEYCIWKSDGAVEYDTLPISVNLKNELVTLCEEFDESLDWNGCIVSPWTKKQFIDFFDRAEKSCQKLQDELRKSHEVVNCLNEDRRMYMDGRIFAEDKF